MHDKNLYKRGVDQSTEVQRVSGSQGFFYNRNVGCWGMLDSLLCKDEDILKFFQQKIKITHFLIFNSK